MGLDELFHGFNVSLRELIEESDQERLLLVVLSHVVLQAFGFDFRTVEDLSSGAWLEELADFFLLLHLFINTMAGKALFRAMGSIINSSLLKLLHQSIN
jgi:hypothetical protein